MRSGFFVPGREVLPLPVSAPGGMKVDLLQTAVAHNAHDIAMRAASGNAATRPSDVNVSALSF
jgi:hypothetical protein